MASNQKFVLNNAKKNQLNEVRSFVVVELSNKQEYTLRKIMRSGLQYR